MIIDATFWVAVSFFIFFGILIYLKVPQKVNNSLTDQINKIKKELDEAEHLKAEAKTVLSDYESKIEKSKKEVKDILDTAKKESDQMILDKTEKFHQQMENQKKNTENKIITMKANAIREIKNISIKISMQVIESLIKTSIDKKKVEKIYSESLKQAKAELKNIKA